ncbi:hypothetical protein Pcinc_015036 [Petrolisthes cinctipes]|uniref:Uncharacterized protein n=1 Tax=Petrolisthes cinctipes TaxID=88211 RepID=A0AAE1KQU3_PETCI|nr:hypothetical protein Pcinc_015036 [Petrolisthes cinctipes]
MMSESVEEEGVNGKDPEKEDDSEEEDLVLLKDETTEALEADSSQQPQIQQQQQFTPDGLSSLHHHQQQEATNVSTTLPVVPLPYQLMTTVAWSCPAVTGRTRSFGHNNKCGRRVHKRSPTSAGDGVPEEL